MARDLEAEQLKDLAYQRGIQEGRRQMADCNADLLAALRAMRESFRQAPAAFTRHGAAMAQCDAAIEKAS